MAHDACRLILPHPRDHPQPQPQGQPRRCGFQRAVPIAGIHIHRPHFHTMLLCVAHDLRRRVEAHRLAVQQRCGERGWVVAFHPGRRVDQLREAGSVAFREAIAAEPLDLAEHPDRELLLIATSHHALDQLVAELRHAAGHLEGGHGAAELIRLVGRELRRHDGQPHRLFLEQRHAQRLAQHLAQLVGRAVLGGWLRVVGRLQPLFATQIGMDHVALDRAGANDRHLDHQVVELLRLQPGQHVHLGAGFDLEDAQAVCPPQHRVGGRAVIRQALQAVVGDAVQPHQIERAAQAGQHAKPQHIDLEDAQRIHVVLVPFQDGAVFHGGIADHRQLDQRPLGDDEAADMRGGVTREILQLLGQFHGHGEVGVGGVQPLGRGEFGQRLLAPRPPARLRQLGGHILRQAHGAAHLADGAAGTVANHGGADRRPLAPIAFVEVLDHLLAPLMFEVDVDVRWLATAFGDEALEQQVVLRGIDGGDLEHVADGGIGRRTAALA